MPSKVNVDVLGNVATVEIDGRFDFNIHGLFKSAYESILGNDDVSTIAVDMWDVSYMDSSALGMLLILGEHAKSVSKSVVLKKPNHMVAQILDLASMAYSDMTDKPSTKLAFKAG